MFWDNFVVIRKPNRGSKYSVEETEVFKLHDRFILGKGPCTLYDDNYTKQEILRFVDNLHPTPLNITVNAGYGWNGSNIVPDTPACMRAVAVHDALCQLVDTGCIKRN